MDLASIDPLKAAVAAHLAQAQSALTHQYDLILSLLERPKNPDHGDYALPCFRLAKALASPPPKAAAFLADSFAADDPLLESTEAVGGFLNLTLRPEVVYSYVVPPLLSKEAFDRLSAEEGKERVMIEYSQPNTHKAFHVGHIRNVALGDALGRLYRYAGYPVVMANYFGDEGVHIAKCLWHLLRVKAQEPLEAKGAFLDEHYRAATKAIELASEDDKERFQAEISEILKGIEAKEGEAFLLWQKTREWSLADFRELYRYFDARFDHDFYESEVSEASQEIVDEYLAKGVFVLDQGAVGCDLKDDKLGFVILRKSDGNTLYATKDLALARVKFDEFQIDRSIYVVASEQNLHFKQVFRTLEKMGFDKASQCYHLSYGMVTLPEGKMSTRSGNTVSCAQLIQEVTAKLQDILAENLKDWSQAERDEACHHLAVGAIRFGMVATDPQKDVVFKLEDWTSFEGFSGPYLMYAYARSCSLLAKASATDFSAPDSPVVGEADERLLLRYLNDFNPTVLMALKTAKLSLLAHYLYDTCKVFNRFLAHHPVLKSEGATRATRLALVAATQALIEQGLSILGIKALERM